MRPMRACDLCRSCAGKTYMGRIIPDQAFISMRPGPGSSPALTHFPLRMKPCRLQEQQRIEGSIVKLASRLSVTRQRGLLAQNLRVDAPSKMIDPTHIVPFGLTW